MRRASRALAVLLALATAAGADVLRLHNGNVVRGRILEETAERVRVAVDGGVLTIPRARIAAIEREVDRPQAPALPDISEAALAPLLAAGRVAEAAERVEAVAGASLAALEAHAQEAARLWVAVGLRARQARDHEAAAAAFERALSWWPLWDRALERDWLDVAGADVRTRLLERGDVAAARERLLGLRDVAPDDPVLAWLAGRAAEAAGRALDAMDAYADAVGGARPDETLDALRARATEAAAGGLPPSGPVDWNAVRTEGAAMLDAPGFRVRHHNAPAAQRVAAALAWHGRRARAWLGPAADPRPDAPVLVDLQVHEELRRTGEPWASGRATTRFEGGAVAFEGIELLQDTPQLLSAAIPHELGHLWLARMVGASPRLLPALSEGFACRCEPPFKRRWYARVREAAGGERLTTRALLSTRRYPPAAQVTLFYACALQLVDALLARGGPGRFAAFCQACGTEEPVAALRRLYGVEPEALDG